MMAAFRRLIVPTTIAVLVAAAPALAQGKGGKDTGERRFYLTKNDHFIQHVLTACEPGFHMASLLEILDISSLKYDTTRGYTKADSGGGPPTNVVGWIRTGGDPSSVGLPGQGNCQNWTEWLPGNGGSVAWIRADWLSTTPSLTGLWAPSASACNEMWRVWCVQD